MSAATVEVADALFCQAHLKEVVRDISILLPPLLPRHLITADRSALNAITTAGRTTTRSMG